MFSGLFVTFESSSSHYSPFSVVSQPEFTSHEIVSIDYSDHDPIKIDGNSDFEAQAKTEGWSGDGTISSPIIIDGLRISSATDTLIDVSTVDLFFTIRNCEVSGSIGAKTGISLKNVNNASLESNNFVSFEDGIYTEGCDKVNITKNDASYCKYGVNVISSFNFIIHDNNLFNNEYAGLHVWNSLSLKNAYHIISNNHAYNNLYWGMHIGYTFYNVIKNNIISNNTHYGLYLSQAQSSEFINNTIKDNGRDGVRFVGGGGMNDFLMNHFVNNGFYGLNLYYTGNNVVKFNSFVGNNANNSEATSQAFDDNKVTSIYHHIWNQNYWDDWNSPDNDSDGFVDNPYLIDGPGNREDSQPLVAFLHEIDSPTIIYPLDEEIINGTITIKWEPSEDSFDHSITYSVAYSNNDGTSWINLTSGTSVLSYSWDTLTVSDGDNYQIKIVATCEYGAFADSISRNIEIDNSWSLSTPGWIYLITLLSLVTLPVLQKRRWKGQK